MEKPKLPPLQVDVAHVKPLRFGDAYESRMILDHVITGRDDVIQINHGTVKAGCALDGGVHDEDEIYYILSGRGRLQLDDRVVDVAPDQVIFIPAGCFHALDNRASDEDMCILTFWRDWRFNDAYAARLKAWGRSFVTTDEELVEILTKFAASGWAVIAAPAQAWLDGKGDRGALMAAIRQADAECGSCGCDFDPLYKRALALLGGDQA